MPVGRLVLALAASVLLTGWGLRDRDPEWPHSGPMPDDPVKVKPYAYAPISQDNQSYRPIDPLRWGDVNRRVAPPGSLPGAPPAKGLKGGTTSTAPAAPQAAPPAAPMVSPPSPLPSAPPMAPMDHSKHGGPSPQPEAKKP